ncbi:XRE family transcriptional regulator [Streptomyces sp. NPDC059255]|uniref:XRE family transcriptional regulator n=1 Tax=Streptomyces sp. NPDC059255 TaxID=3346793 RepID=UPI0036B7BB96
MSVRRGIPVGTGKDGVYRWEAGRCPDQPTRYLIAELLGIPQEAVDQYPWPHWLALDPLQQPTRYSWDASGAIQALAEVSGRENMTMDRRHFTLLTGTTLTTSLWAWLTADPAAAGQLARARRLGETEVARVEERVRQLRHADDIDGGGQLLAETAVGLELVVNLMKNRSYTNAHGARLHAAAADLARMHAWATFDVHDTCADGVFHAALRSAHASGDTVLGSHILAFWSIAANNTDRPADAESMTDAALSAARGRTTPRVEAMLYSRRARARAHQNNPAALTDLDQAAALLDTADRNLGEDPEWVAWFDRSELLGAIASTHLDLNQPDRAENTFVQSAALFPVDQRVRTHTLFLARRADAQWRQNEPERACATAHQALDLTEEISSHRAAGPLRDLAASMAERAEIPAVRDFRERVTTALRT